ncbi:hypothetical protein FOL47_002598 [Perkinsus chesapeaki]|uniref:glutaminase n=1 Tax=Perkinsus chesapeaki TaxID=330153 RepID=A0A7J6MDB7_PERCH|nr:hypothetical protein FOL47_002598 [Perkinsus chesapeaki]
MSCIASNVCPSNLAPVKEVADKNVGEKMEEIYPTGGVSSVGVTVACLLYVFGAFSEHCIVLGKLDVKGVKITPCEVRTLAELNACDGLIIPGGESTAMKIISEGGEDDIIEGMRQFALSGHPIWGTCAGTILLAKTVCQSSRDGSGAIVEHTECKYGNPIGVMDIRVSRNYFGRQLNSFEATIDDGCVFGGVPAVFIRAPAILDVDPKKVTVLGPLICAAKEENMMVTCFHPELTDDHTVPRREGVLAT